METEENTKDIWFNSNLIKDVSKGVKNTFYIVILLCIFFITMEALGAYFSNSIAIFTDVGHLFSDLIGFIVSLISIFLSG